MDPSPDSPETPVSDWQSIPETNFLETLPPGQYLLHSHFVEDLYKNLVLEGTDIETLKTCEVSIEHVQHNQLAQIINEKLRLYNIKIEKLKTDHSMNNQYERHNLRAKLKNINECLLKGFDSFVPVEVERDLLASFDSVLNPSPSSSLNANEDLESLNHFNNALESSTEGSDVDNDQSFSSSNNDEVLLEEESGNNLKLAIAACITCMHESDEYKVPTRVRSSVLSGSDDDAGDFAETINVEHYTTTGDPSTPYGTISLKEFSISMYRLENELSTEKLEELWIKYYNSKSIRTEKISSNRKQTYSQMQHLKTPKNNGNDAQISHEINDCEQNIPQEIRLAFQRAHLL